MRLTVTKPMRYRGKAYKPGESVEVEKQHAPAFTHYLKTAVPTAAAPPADNTVPARWPESQATPDETPASLTDTDARGTDAPSDTPPKRRYRRRDMAADEES